jgi:glycosyltransferase involved in cell wall biosynthesis
MQSYEPLASKYELTGYAGAMNSYDVSGLKFPVRRLHKAEEYYEGLHWPLNSLAYGALLSRGMNYRMFGLEKELADQDILHAAETYNGYSYQCALAKGNKKLALTVWENIPFASFRNFKGLTNNHKIVDYVKDRTDVFIAVTGRANVALQIEGVPEDRIRDIPVGVDTSRFRPEGRDPLMREHVGAKEDDFLVLFVARLTKEKGVYDLLHAIKLIALDPTLGHVKVAIAGSGPEKDSMASLIGKLGIGDRVRLIGSFTYDEIPKLYHAADAFILPSTAVHYWQEQFGMVLIEAMACGLPVISTRSGSIPEVVGDSGLLIQPNDPLSIYNEIKRLALDARSRGRRRRGPGRAVARAASAWCCCSSRAASTALR